jgi:alpha-glucosidase
MQHQIYSKNRPENLDFLERLRALTDMYEARTMVGEVGETVNSLSLMEAYTRGTSRLHMAYSFDMLSPDFSAQHFRSRIEGFFQGAPDGWPSWSFSNHDVMRHVSRWENHAVDQDRIAKLAIGMLAGFEGTIGLYNGEELGQTDTELAYHELTDVQGLEFWPKDKGRDGCRSPIVWDASEDNGGFSSATPWLPVKPPQLSRAVSLQAQQNDSVLQHYKSVLAYRRATPELRSGKTTFIDLPEPILGFYRLQEASGVTCLYNLSPEPITLAVDGAADMDGPSQSAHLSQGVLSLGGNGFVFMRHGPEGPKISIP